MCHRGTYHDTSRKKHNRRVIQETDAVTCMELRILNKAAVFYNCNTEQGQRIGLQKPPIKHPAILRSALRPAEATSQTPSCIEHGSPAGGDWYTRKEPYPPLTLVKVSRSQSYEHELIDTHFQ